MGAPYQWTSDITEHCHITHVKTPYRLSSHRNFHEQCCRYMDCVEKCLTFTMYTTTKTLGPTLATEITNEANQVTIDDSELPLLTSPESNVGTAPTALASLFMKACSHFTDDQTAAFMVAITQHFAGVPVATDMSNSRCLISRLLLVTSSFLNNCTLPIMRKGKAESIAHFLSIAHFISNASTFGSLSICNDTLHRTLKSLSQSTLFKHSSHLMNYLLNVVILCWLTSPIGMVFQVCSHIQLLCEYFLRSIIYQISEFSIFTL